MPWEQATVHLLSHSLQRGSLVFDYLSLYELDTGPALFRLDEHVKRFLRSTELVGLPIDYSAAEIEAAALVTAAANPGARAIKLCAYLPSIEVDVVPLDERVSLAIAAYDPKADVIARSANATPYKAPAELRLWIEKRVRNRREDIMPPQAKVAANYTAPMTAKWAARRAGYDDILLVDENGFVAEGPTSNLFWVDAQGVLHTPPSERVLSGVTRASLIEIAAHEGIPVSETRIRPEELMRAPEVFLSGTTAGVWPVGSIDGQALALPAPGPVSSRLRESFRRVVAGREPAFRHWLRPVAGG